MSDPYKPMRSKNQQTHNNQYYCKMVLPLSAAKGKRSYRHEKNPEVASREHPRQDISLHEFLEKGQSKNSGNFLLASPGLFFFSSLSLFIFFLPSIPSSYPGLPRGNFYRSYRRILEASYIQRSAQAQSSPPKLTLTGVPEGLTQEELFRSAYDLFEEPALTWYRFVRDGIGDWQSLVKLLKKNFLPPDYDERLLDEIKSRYQSRDESPAIYVALMNNILIELCQKIDDAYEAKKRIAPAVKNRNPQLHVSEITATSGSKGDKNNAKISNTVCWNCDTSGHVYSQCSAKRNIFCFRCGKKALTQIQDSAEHVIAYASRTLSKTERNYSVGERKALAVIFAIEKFRAYVEGVKFTVVTDHSSLGDLSKMWNPSGHLARWSLKLQQFDFDIIYRKGAYQRVPDTLSRAFLQPFSREEADSDRYPQWKIEDDLIYKYIPARIPFEANVRERKLYVPAEQRQQVLLECHDHPTASHFGIFKTLSRVRDNYYWPKMIKQVTKYVKSWQTYGEQKPSFTGKLGLMGREKNVRFPWQVIAIDFMGPFPKSRLVCGVVAIKEGKCLVNGSSYSVTTARNLPVAPSEISRRNIGYNQFGSMHGITRKLISLREHTEASAPPLEAITVDPIVEDVEISPGDRNCHAAELRSLKIIFNEVRHKLYRAYVRYSNRYNLDRRDIQFEVGQKVWRRNKVLSDQARGYSAKLALRYVLCLITRKVSPIVYELQNEDGSNADRWHVQDLNPYFGSDEDLFDSSATSSDTSNYEPSDKD
ncbi:hypothetical protein GEV33_006706 [Tenebrio molitor]|uniref:RNA-directed DNA polymerase n=1 Tax=Tenebrio molitor TaxID=7067 RepID=A0A8J6HLB0_TENMO|nr:hypothetical protein GEV33_006706 [Tenebrio molitor]